MGLPLLVLSIYIWILQLTPACAKEVDSSQRVFQQEVRSMSVEY